MRKGFVLIELLMATVIASLISIALMTTIFQISRLRDTVNSVTSIYGRLAIVQGQMERDIMGAFIPTQVDLVQSATGKPADKRTKPLETVFEGTLQDKKFDMLTFITSNPLNVYEHAKNVQPKARVARVVYRLQREKRKKESYALMRQEGQRLPVGLYTKEAKEELRAFPLIDGISEFTVTYIKPGKKKSEKDASENAAEKNADESGRPQFQRMTAWKNEQKEGTRSVELPSYVEVTVVLWDTLFENKKKFTFTIPLDGQLSWQQEKKKGAPSKDDSSSVIIETTVGAKNDKAPA